MIKEDFLKMTKEEEEKDNDRTKEEEEKEKENERTKEEEKENNTEWTWSETQLLALNLFENGKNIFLSGPGGSGKSQLIKEFRKRAEMKNEKMEILALTGCAACLFESAKTLHSFFMLGNAQESKNKIIEKTYVKMYPKFRHLSILVIDEISMMSAKLFEIVIGILRKCNYIDRIQLIFVGDFFQLPPVFDKGENDKRMCFQHEEFQTIFPWNQTILLNKIFRQNDLDFQRILNNMRFGLIRNEDISLLFRYLHRPVNLEKTHGIMPCKIFSKKNQVEELNKRELEKLPSEIVTSVPFYVNGYDDTMIDFLSKKRLSTSSNSSLSSLLCSSEKTKRKKIKSLSLSSSSTPSSSTKEKKKENDDNDDEKYEDNGDNDDDDGEQSSLIPNEDQCYQEFEKISKDIKEPLTLKIGAKVMVTKNINIMMGLCNGKQGIVVGFCNDNPQVLFTDGSTFIITRFKQSSDKFPKLSVYHYPLMLAWAVTVHKMQGASLDHAELNLGSSIFADGQMYVALSRIRSLDGLYLSAFDPSKLRANESVKEFYSQIAFSQLKDKMMLQIANQTHEMKKILYQGFLNRIESNLELQKEIMLKCMLCEDLNFNIFQSSFFCEFIESLKEKSKLKHSHETKIKL